MNNEFRINDWIIMKAFGLDRYAMILKQTPTRLRLCYYDTKKEIMLNVGEIKRRLENFENE